MAVETVIVDLDRPLAFPGKPVFSNAYSGNVFQLRHVSAHCMAPVGASNRSDAIVDREAADSATFDDALA